VVDAPAPSSPFQAALDTVTVEPDCAYVPDQPLWTAPPEGRAKEVFQLLIIALPFFTVTAAW
jgi:hypothetical protein